jgi:hypothetical protein
MHITSRGTDNNSGPQFLPKILCVGMTGIRTGHFRMTVFNKAIV